jgi:hypothetical protein
MPFLLFLALDPVEHERAQAKVSHENGKPDEPSADHFIAYGFGQTISPDTNAVCDLHDGEKPVDVVTSPTLENEKITPIIIIT